MDRRLGTAALFDLEGETLPPTWLALEGVEPRADDILSLRYRVLAPGDDGRAERGSR